MSRHDLFQATSFSPERAWADTWHLWTVMIPRRSITGRLLWGRVWRRHDGRRWIYKKFVEFEPDDLISAFNEIGSAYLLVDCAAAKLRAENQGAADHNQGHRHQQIGRCRAIDARSDDRIGLAYGRCYQVHYFNPNIQPTINSRTLTLPAPAPSKQWQRRLPSHPTKK